MPTPAEIEWARFAGGRFNGKPSAVIAAYQLPGSNALEAAAGVKKLMAQMRQRFPEGLDFVTTIDTTLSVTQGMEGNCRYPF